MISVAFLFLSSFPNSHLGMHFPPSSCLTSMHTACATRAITMQSFEDGHSQAGTWEREPATSCRNALKLSRGGSPNKPPVAGAGAGGLPVFDGA